MNKIVRKYILRPGRYIKKCLLRLISYPFHLGSVDYYPPMHYFPIPTIPLIRGISFPALTRIKYWTAIAKSYKPFQPFYSEPNKKNYLEIPSF